MTEKSGYGDTANNEIESLSDEDLEIVAGGSANAERVYTHTVSDHGIDATALNPWGVKSFSIDLTM